jgi:probable rRNA maturation factor
MASGKQNDDEHAPSEVSIAVGKGIRLSESDTNELADFAAGACEAILSLDGRARPAQKRATVLPPSRIDVVIAANPEIRRLNREFRGQDKPTDVISFPIAEPSHGAIEGDIAISASIAAANARRLGHSLADEVKILILHGMLHLAGYDHESDRGQMSQLEAGLRRVLQLPGTLIERVAQPPSAVRESRGTRRLARSGRAKRVSRSRSAR